MCLHPARGGTHEDYLPWRTPIDSIITLSRLASPFHRRFLLSPVQLARSNVAHLVSASAMSSTRSVRRDEAAEGITPADIVPADALSLVAARTGYLLKRSEHGLIRSWRRRFTILHATHLLYYDSESSSIPRGVIYLEEAAISLARVTAFRGAPLCMTLRTRSGRVFYFKGEGGAEEYDMRSWFESIAAVTGVVVVDSVATTTSTTAPAPAAPASVVSTPVASSEGVGEDEPQTEDEEEAGVLVIPPAPGMSLREPSSATSTRAASAGRVASSAGSAGAASMPSAGDGLPRDAATAYGITDDVLAEVGAMSPAAQIAWMSLLPLMQSTHELQAENAALRAQIPALLKARVEAQAVAERDQTTIAVLTRQLGGMAQGAPADVLTAVAAERRVWEARLAAAESSWSERLKKAEADVDARVAQELRESMDDLRNAERAGRRAVEERATEEATSLATREMSAAIHQVRTAKNVEIDALRAALSELCIAAGAAGVAVAPNVCELARARAPSGIVAPADDAESTSSAAAADDVRAVDDGTRAALTAAQDRAHAAEAEAVIIRSALCDTQAQLLQMQQRAAATSAAAAGGADTAAATQTFLELKVDELTRMLRVSAEEKERLVADVARLQAQVQALELQTSGLSADLAEARSSNDELRGIMLQTVSESTVDAVVASLRMENEGLRGELDDFMAASALHKSDRAAWREHVQALEVRCATLQARSDAMQAQLGMRPAVAAPATPRTPASTRPIMLA